LDLLSIDGSVSLSIQDRALSFYQARADLGGKAAEADSNGVAVPMIGNQVALLWELDERVKKGDGLLVMEATKMELTIRASAAGQVSVFLFQPGDLVNGGAVLLLFDTGEDSHPQGE
jgi:3-methylcrotonyl-CoA carboxylase alpha subunit